MLDIKRIRENAAEVNAALQRRSSELSVDKILALDVQRRKLLLEEETLRSQRNQMTQEIAVLKRSQQDATELMEKTKALGERVKAIEAEKDALENEQNQLLLDIPNTPMDSVPNGKSAEDNVVVKVWGETGPNHTGLENEKVLPHWEIGTQLGILDFERGVKLAHSRFSILRKEASQLTRALISFMLDTHAQHGYEEILPPFLVNRAAMTGTGQLPKFEADMFHCPENDLFLIPTAEVPLTNMYGGELLEAGDLPRLLTAYTPCFRREAGSAGQDTRGLIRQHQFDKVELVQLVAPESSDHYHQKLVADAERILQLLELPYRVVELCAGDMGFGASHCFDLEVWMPSQGVYREISSCSNFQDFQARRAGLKYRSPETGKAIFLHTLNGSGLAVGRTIAAILENYQTADGSIIIPTILQPYFRNGITTIKAESALAKTSSH